MSVRVRRGGRIVSRPIASADRARAMLIAWAGDSDVQRTDTELVAAAERRITWDGELALGGWYAEKLADAKRLLGVA